MIITIVLVGFLALAFTGSIFTLVFAPIVVYVLWRDSKRIKELEKQLAELENLSPKKSGTKEVNKGA
ncbi:MAG TPA: hypothetical protein VN739_06385 [Nitrososphaerales archaeon]|nr:hypothetical protein [Nitrososphaerales archaeon]